MPLTINRRLGPSLHDELGPSIWPPNISVSYSFLWMDPLKSIYIIR